MRAAVNQTRLPTLRPPALRWVLGRFMRQVSFRTFLPRDGIELHQLLQWDVKRLMEALHHGRPHTDALVPEIPGLLALKSHLVGELEDAAKEAKRMIDDGEVEEPNGEDLNSWVIGAGGEFLDVDEYHVTVTTAQ
jgi:hypothetical protein